MTTTELTLPPAIDDMDTTLAQVEPAKIAKMPRMQKALTVAKAMRTLRQLMAGPVIADVMQLQGTELGFRTDKDREGGYPEEAVRDCTIAALMKGAQICGNEFNIIAGRSYLTKEFFERAVAEFPGLTDLKLAEGVPVTQGNGALVTYTATWRMQGVPDEIRCEKTDGCDTRIPVRVNSQMGTDAILGKAKRKMLAKVYARLTGSAVGEFISEEQETPAEETTYVENWREEFGLALERCSGINEVNAIEDHYLRIAGSESEGAEINGRCDERREAIRATRGERSGK